MASFDIIDSASYAYKLVWTERRYLARMALVPVAVQVFCQAGVTAFGWQTDFIRQALIMLPSYFTEGWLFSHLVRLIFLGQRWPFRPTGNRDNDVAMLQDRAQGIMGGTLFYVVIRFLMAGVATLMYGVSQEISPDKTESPDTALILAGVALMVFFIWGFRLLWLYIPAALNVPVRGFLSAIRGFSTSLYLMGAWLVSFMPLMMVYVFVTSFIVSLAGSPEAIPLPAKVTIDIFRTAIDIAIGTLATASIAHGIRVMMNPPGRTGITV